MADVYNATQVARSCLDKRAYPTRTDARRAKRIMASKKRCVFSIYFCSHCGNWHLTHQARGMRA
jgi:ribosomal protein L32